MDDDTYADHETGAFDERQGTGFDAAALTTETVLAQLASSVTLQAASETSANRLPGEFGALANLLAQDKELLYMCA